MSEGGTIEPGKITMVLGKTRATPSLKIEKRFFVIHNPHFESKPSLYISVHHSVCWFIGIYRSPVNCGSHYLVQFKKKGTKCIPHQASWKEIVYPPKHPARKVLTTPSILSQTMPSTFATLELRPTLVEHIISDEEMLRAWINHVEECNQLNIPTNKTRLSEQLRVPRSTLRNVIDRAEMESYGIYSNSVGRPPVITRKQSAVLTCLALSGMITRDQQYANMLGEISGVRVTRSAVNKHFRNKLFSKVKKIKVPLS